MGFIKKRIYRDLWLYVYFLSFRTDGVLKMEFLVKLKPFFILMRTNILFQETCHILLWLLKDNHHMPYHDNLATAYTVPLWKLEIHLDDIFFGKGNYMLKYSKYIVVMFW